MSKKQIVILIVIVIAQFMCTSLWFAGNAIMPQLSEVLSLTSTDVGWMTSSVQLGFIVGTIFYAFFTIADRFKASNVFVISALLGSISNWMITLPGLDYSTILLFRFLTGFFLAGIYPVGMKIASDFFEKGLGKALSFLVGALVLGTALPHLVASWGTSLDWEVVLYITSILALIGGLMVKGFVGEGPFRKTGATPSFIEIGNVFKHKEFRAASIGYFGHMWELYAFWAFIPFMMRLNGDLGFDSIQISFYSFLVIALGALACFIGGFISEKFGTKRTATIFLLLSGLCCLISPFTFELHSSIYLAFMIFWGMVVIADSPLFSTLVAQEADPQLKGTALTLVTSIGFAITIVSIQLISFLINVMDERFVFLILAVGPASGLYYLRRSIINTASS
ncbi:MAG: MFS transporter [Bacteroidota bacterium]